MARINYDYLAGLFDGEGSFVVSISERKRNDDKISLSLYMWASITQASQGGQRLLEQVAEWLNNEGIRARLLKSTTHLQLRVVHMNSLEKLCDRLNGKLLLKQDELENFRLILSLRKRHQETEAKYRSINGFRGGGYLKYKEWTDELIDYYRTIAIIWDNTIRSRNRPLHYCEQKLFSILERKGLL